MDSVASPACARPQPSAAARPAETKQRSEVIRGSRRAHAMLLADCVHECSPQYPQGPAPPAEGIAPCFVELCEAVVAVNDVKRPSQFGQERDCLCPFRSKWQARAAMPEVACKL